MVKNGGGLIDYGTHKSGVSHKWFDELSRLMECFLHADSDGTIFGFQVFFFFLLYQKIYITLTNKYKLIY